MLITGIVISAVVILMLFQIPTAEERTVLNVRAMEQIWGGWSCINTKKCKTNPTAPGGFKYCAWRNNYIKCPPFKTDCQACDPHWGGEDMYCIGSEIGVPCLRRTSSCGPAFEGICFQHICQAVSMEPIEGVSCGDWNECKNES